MSFILFLFFGNSLKIKKRIYGISSYIFGIENIFFPKVSVSLFIAGVIFTPPALAESSPQTVDDLQSAIEIMTSEAQGLEDLIMLRQKTLDDSKKQMKQYLIQVHEKSSDIVGLIHYLHRMKTFSSLLTPLTFKKVEDIIHLKIVLKSISPYRSERFSQDLDLLQNLATSRHQLKKERLEVENLEKNRKKVFIHLKKQFRDLETLLYETDQPFPVRHFDSQKEVEEVINHLTVHAMNCKQTTELPQEEGNKILLTAPTTTKEETLYYENLKDRVIRSPMDAQVLFAGNSQETGGILLLQKDPYVFLIEGIDKILRYPGTFVKQQQSLGMIFGSTKKPKELAVTLWKCQSIKEEERKDNKK